MVVVALLFAGCRTPPRRVALHYEATKPVGWIAVGGGRLTTTMLGAKIAVILDPREPRIELAVENPTAARIQVRVGPEAASNPTAAIGEVQHRRIDRTREGSSDFLPCLALQPVAIEPGFCAAYYLDSPLGRDPAIGHYLVLVVELQAPNGARQRRLLPLVATNTPAEPARR